jgi:ribosomal protein L37E
MPTPIDCRRCGLPYYGAAGLLCDECEREAKRPVDAAWIEEHSPENTQAQARPALPDAECSEQPTNQTMNEQVKDIILSYCEGNAYQEFSIDDLNEMVEKIIDFVAEQVESKY